jgi:hypothetical protein
MTPEALRTLLESVGSGERSVDSALETLRDLPYESLGFATVDHHRALRQGFPEVIFGAGKTPEQIAAIAERLASRGATVLATRASREAYERTREVLPTAIYHDSPRLILVEGAKPTLHGRAGVLCAGTSDLPMAEEAAICLEAMGGEVERLYDVGVAGIHRLLGRIDVLRDCRALIVVAGMEGALPSVVGGLVSVPVIAVPTSVGYGAAFGGLAALLGMLNTCASGVAVVNIDNGFGAAAFVASILRDGPVSR